MVHKGAEHTEELAQTGLIAVLDAPFLQKDDIIQKEGLGDVGEIVAGQFLAVFCLDEVRERIAELLVHRSGTDAFDELAVLDFLVVLEVIDAGLKQLRDGQYLRLLFLLGFGFETVGPLQDGEVVLLAFPLLGDGHVFALDVEQQLVLLDVFAAGGGEALGFVVPVLVSSRNVDYARDAVVTGLVEDHFQLDHLGVLWVPTTLECDRKHILLIDLVALVLLYSLMQNPTWNPT